VSGRETLLADPVSDRVWVAMIELNAEGGYAALSVEALVERSGVPRAVFDARYADLDDCVLKVFGEAIEDYEAKVLAAYEAADGWRPGLRAAAYAAADWIAAHPLATRFGTVDVLQARGEMIRVRIERLYRFCAELIDRGRAEAPDPGAIPEFAAQMAIGSITRILVLDLEKSGQVDPVAMVPRMLEMAVRPYVGEESAREELSAPRPDLGRTAADPNPG
jgi:AcrR family transcriptional regulator